MSVERAATILAGLRTEAGRDAVTLVALGLDPLAAAFDTEHSGQHHLNRVFDMVDPLQPNHDHHLSLDVMTHLCAVAPKDVRFVVLAQASFVAWFLRMRPEAVAFLNAAIDANPEAVTEYRLGAVVHQDVEPGHAIHQCHAAASH